MYKRTTTNLEFIEMHIGGTQKWADTFNTCFNNHHNSNHIWFDSSWGVIVGFSIWNQYKHWSYQEPVFPLLHIIPWKHETKYVYSIWFYGNMWVLKYVQLAIYSRCYHNLASSVDYSYQEEYCSFLPWYHLQYKNVDTFTQKTNMHEIHSFRITVLIFCNLLILVSPIQKLPNITIS